MGSTRWRQVDALWARARSIEVSPRQTYGTGRSVMVGLPDTVAELAGLLEVDLTAAPFTCACWGDVTFAVRGEFGTNLGTLTLHLDTGLHWHRWRGQFPLLRPQELTRWLLRHEVMR
ncbi:hypothetical protein [Streptomyces sp. AN091965]|uniref:hypothetical protein n=1 Tax=Streptomyces sp. AN091965 TaxID=2927803 RepID=UPI001F61FB3E|nr:hypothetical protein [Streptomyces sp. AN091965]MCI3928070.1 hypothetical protein [Streptomyces sp. AN091965]